MEAGIPSQSNHSVGLCAPTVNAWIRCMKAQVRNTPTREIPDSDHVPPVTRRRTWVSARNQPTMLYVTATNRFPKKVADVKSTPALRRPVTSPVAVHMGCALNTCGGRVTAQAADQPTTRANIVSTTAKERG